MSAEKMYIAGEWSDSENGDVSQAINPATGESIATVPKATVNDVNRSVEASRAALQSSEWKNMDPAQRGRMLNKMAAVTYGAAKELAKLNLRIMVKPSGKHCRNPLRCLDLSILLV